MKYNKSNKEGVINEIDTNKCRVGIFQNNQSIHFYLYISHQISFEGVINEIDTNKCR